MSAEAPGEQTADQASYVCSHVLDHSRPVLLVVREHDGDWVATCGGNDHEQSTGSWFVVGWGHVLEWNSAVGDITALERGEEAERSDVTASWVVSPVAPFD